MRKPMGQYVDLPRSPFEASVEDDYAPIGEAPDGTPFPNQNAQFLQWIFNFKKEVTVPLRYLWRGYEQDETGRWLKKKSKKDADGNIIEGNFRVMNEKGITWSISLIESYINPVYVLSNYSEEDLNWTIRQLGRVVYNNLCARYEEFQLHRLDIQRVANEIVSKVHAILLGARNNGYRMFLSSTHSTSEVSTRQQSGGKSGGVLPNIKNLFMR